MAIYAPGKRDRNNRPKRSGKRKVLVALSLTAMVDMFTVLTVFLLQNYKSTGEVLHIPKNVVLPTASQVKELTPAHVVTVSPDKVLLDDVIITDFERVKQQNDWLIQPLFTVLTDKIRDDEIQFRKDLKNRVKSAVYGKDKASQEDEAKKFRRITVQADKDIDFLSIKKVMYTVTEAGGAEINFAVITKSRKKVELE
jgi:biopolymer transport protein ExbD